MRTPPHQPSQGSAHLVAGRPPSGLGGGASINKLRKLDDKEDDEVADVTEDDDTDDGQGDEAHDRPGDPKVP